MNSKRPLGAALISASLLVTALPWSGVHAQTRAGIPQGGTIIAAEADIASTLNPLLNQQLSTFDIDTAIFDGLVKTGDKGQFMPDLATSWTSSPDGLKWVFHLNPKATWQDGAPFKANDVVFTANLVNNPAFGATATQGFDHIKTIKAAGNEEVDITLTSPFAPFLQDYATTPILPQHVLGKIAVAKIRTDAQYNREPLGTGPFKVSQYVAGDHITLVANPNYFLGAPHLAQIIFRVVPSSATVVNQMETGEVTLAGQTADLSAQQFNVLKHAPDMTPYVTPGFNWNHIDLVETGFFKDVKVRQALQTATDRNHIIKLIALGYGTPQYSDQPAAKTQYYNPAVESYWPYSPAKAEAMLKADGFTKGSNGTLEKGGVPFNITLWGDSGGGPGITELLQIIKAEWGQIGVNVNVRLLDAATLFGRTGPLYDPNRLQSSSMNAVEYEWIEPADPDDTFFWTTKEIISSKIVAGGNFDGYSNPQVDQLTAQGLVTTDPAKRAAIYKKLQLILANDVPDIWLYWGKVLSVATTKLHNYDPNPFNFNLAWNAKDWYLQ